ncbi:MAG: NUDIX hydrolase [Alcanivoracaceae bacterium]
MNSFEPHITVATVVEQEGRFLLVREQADGKLVLNQPAGHVEAGESVTQAAFRETLEETAWQVEITALLGIYIYQPRRGAGVYYRLCFAASPLHHDPRQKLDTGITGAEWLTVEELRACQSEHRSPLVMRCVEDYLSGRRLPLDAIYQHPWPLQQR